MANIDVFGALARKKKWLIAEKDAIDAEYARKIADIQSQIAEIETAEATIHEAVRDFLCPKCSGTGERRKTDAAGQMETVKCEVCHGTGVRT